MPLSIQRKRTVQNLLTQSNQYDAVQRLESKSSGGRRVTRSRGILSTAGNSGSSCCLMMAYDYALAMLRVSRWSLFLFDDSLEILSPVRGGVRSEGERRRIAWHEAYESLAEARRNTERNARAANLGLPSLAATKRHYPRLDTLATLSLLPLPLAIPLCHSTPSSRFFFLFRTNVLSLSLSFSHLSCSRFTDLASFSNSRDLCT